MLFKAFKYTFKERCTLMWYLCHIPTVQFSKIKLPWMFTMQSFSQNSTYANKAVTNGDAPKSNFKQTDFVQISNTETKCSPTKKMRPTQVTPQTQKVIKYQLRKPFFLTANPNDLCKLKLESHIKLSVSTLPWLNKKIRLKKSHIWCRFGWF